MSKENLDQFIQQISDSEELQVRVGEEIDADAFIALGAEHGCEFSAEDLAENAELSDEELGGVVGGVGRSVRVITTEFDMGEGGQTFVTVTGLTGPVGGTLDRTPD